MGLASYLFFEYFNHSPQDFTSGVWLFIAVMISAFSSILFLLAFCHLESFHEEGDSETFGVTNSLAVMGLAIMKMAYPLKVNIFVYMHVYINQTSTTPGH